jgi:hypothetical protein
MRKKSTMSEFGEALKVKGQDTCHGKRPILEQKQGRENPNVLDNYQF